MGKNLIRLACGNDACISHDDVSGLDAVFRVSIRNNKHDGNSGTLALPDGKSVAVIEVCAAEQTGEARHRAEDLAAFPGQQGIGASAQIVNRDGRPGSDQIVTFAEEHRAGLIAAGGTGRARLREWVMGGVTQGLLDRSPVCRLLSH